MTLLHTPGHTPDELALYDPAEKMLYVGDSLYEYEDIIFPKEGSIVEWFTSLDYLIDFVNDENQNNCNVATEVLINSGHRTVIQPALEVLGEARAFMVQVVQETEPVKERLIVRGEDTVVYRQKGGRFSLRCPERLVEDVRQNGKLLFLFPRSKEILLQLSQECVSLSGGWFRLSFSSPLIRC